MRPLLASRRYAAANLGPHRAAVDQPPRRAHQCVSTQPRSKADLAIPIDTGPNAAMVQTTTVERELTALAELRLRWRGKPEVIELIDAAMTTLTDLARAYGSDPIEGIDADALRLASLVQRALATVS